MEHQLSHSFYLRTSKRRKSDKHCPIYLRITINGQRLDDATGRYVDPCYWIKGAGKLKKSTEDNRQINLYLETLTAKIHKMEREMIQDGKTITYDIFRDAWQGDSEKGKMLLEIFQHHNDHLAGLVNEEQAAAGTLDRYNTAFDHVKAFIVWKYKITDIAIKRLNYEFVSDYDYWLKTERHCAHNTSMKYISNLKKITNICVRHGWLSKDPFFGYKLAKHDVTKEPLTMEELELLAGKTFDIDRLNHVKDIFLFSCFTGLAYADVKKLTKWQITRIQDGSEWIHTNRQKTKTLCRIPLLPFAKAILGKYREHPSCIVSGVALPVPTNQKMNAYLKEIGDLCGVKKNLTFHQARYTFATTIALDNGIPIETIAKILGHKTIRTTQHYAKVTDKKMTRDIGILHQKTNWLGNAATISPNAKPADSPVNDKQVLTEIINHTQSAGRNLEQEQISD